MFGYRSRVRLDDLPDKPRFGVNLMICGSVLGVFRFAWPRLSSGSFQRASEAFLRFDRYIPYRHHYQPSVEDFGTWLWIVAIACIVAGAFIFLRRGFWWVAEHRSDPDTTGLKFK